METSARMPRQQGLPQLRCSGQFDNVACDLRSKVLGAKPAFLEDPEAAWPCQEPGLQGIAMIRCGKGWRSSPPSRQSSERSALQGSDTPWESLTRLPASTTVHGSWRRLALRLRMGARWDCMIRDILILPTISCLARRKTHLGANVRMAIMLELGVTPGLIAKTSATTSRVTILEPGIWKSRNKIVPER